MCTWHTCLKHLLRSNWSQISYAYVFSCHQQSENYGCKQITDFSHQRTVIKVFLFLKWVLYYRSTAITGGTLCVDTFFMISGMLVSIGFFQQVEKLGKLNWVLFYLYRYMRITPPLAIVVLIYATLIHRFGSGPLWHDMLDIVQKPCQEYWWATLLHIQNYVHPFPLVSVINWKLNWDYQRYSRVTPISY